jgi:lysophospholipase L1-like esterase
LQPTLAAKGSANQYPGYIVSDWIPLQSVAPTDGAKFPYLIARAKHQETVSTITTVNNQSDTCADAAVKDSPIYCENFHFTGDGITTPSNFSPGSAQTRSILSGFEFLGKQKAVRVLCLGDSITGGTDGENTGFIQNYAWGNRAQGILQAAEVPANFINYGYGGSLSSVYADYGKLAVARHKPAIAIYSPFSPNDGSPNAQAYVDARMATARDFALYCFQNGVLPVYSFLAPGTYNATEDGWRKKLITEARSSGIPVLDLCAVISDTATPQRFLPAYDGDDTIHPNAAAYAAQAPVCAEFIKAIIDNNRNW